MLSLEQVFIRTIEDYKRSDLVELLTDMVQHKLTIDQVVYNIAFGRPIQAPLPQ